MMGLIYDSGDSTSVKAALSANLTAASQVLDQLQSGSDRLIAALGSGQLSGKGYSAVDALFAQVIAPCVKDAKNEIGSIRGELDRYAYEDSKVSQFGVLKEDELKTQLAAKKNQRDATERRIESNRRAASAATTVPGLAESLHASNSQLEMVLAQLENDIRDLEDKLTALQDFASATKGLFLTSTENLAAATGDTVALLKQLNDTRHGFKFTDAGKTGLLATAARRDILNFLAGKKLTRDAKGRVKWGGKYLYNVKTENLYGWGKEFNKETKIKIDRYGHPIKTGVRAAAESPLEDFRGWKGASKLTKFGKGFGAAGTVVTVGANYVTYFGDGAQGYDVPDFAVDTGIDLASAAVAAGAGAAIGSLILPPLGTVVGGLVGFLAGVALSPAADAAKEEIKKAYR